MAEYTETLRLVVDVSDLQSAIRDIQRQVESAQRSTTSAGKSMSGSMEDVEDSANAVGKAMGNIGGAASGAAKTVGNAFSALSTGATIAVGAVTATAVGLAKTGLGYIDLWQKSTAAWTTILGSAEKSRSMMEDLAAFSSKMPFGRATWIQGTQQLLGFGVAAEKVIPTLQAVGDAVAATGGGAQDVQDVARILAQVSATGKITGDTLMQLGVRGINAAQLIGDQFGKTSAQVQAAITAGTLSGQKGYDALVKGMTEKYAGAGANVSKTFSGMMGGITSRLRDLGTAIVEPFVSREGGGYIIEWGTRITDIINGFTKMFGPVWQSIVDKWKPALDGFTRFLDNVKTSITGIDVKGFVDQIGRLGKFLAPIGAAVLSMGSANLAGMLGPFGALLPRINPLLAAVATLLLSIPKVRDALKNVIPWVMDLGKALGQAFTGDEGALGVVGDLIEKAFGPKVASMVRPLLQRLMDFLKWVKDSGGWLALFQKGWAKVQEIMGRVIGFITNKVIPKLKELGDWLGPKLRKVFDFLQQVWPKVQDAVGRFVRFIQENWPKVQDALGGIKTFIENEVVPAFEKIRDWLWPKLQQAYDWWNNAWPQIQQAMSDVMAFIEAEVVPKFEALKAWLNGPEVQAAFTWVTETAWPTFKQAIQDVVDYIPTAIKGLEDLATAVGKSLGTPRDAADQPAAPESFLDDLHAIFDNMAASLDAWKGTASALKDIWDMLKPDQVEGLSSGMSALGTVFSTILDPLKNASEGFLTMSQAIEGATEKVRDFLKLLQDNNVSKETIWSAISNPLEAPAVIGAGLTQGKVTGEASTLGTGQASAGVGAALNAGIQATNLNPTNPTDANVLANALTANTAPVTDAGQEAGTSFADGLVTGLTGPLGLPLATTAATEGTNGMVDAVKNQLGIKSPSTVMQDIGESMMEGFALGITDNLDPIKAAMNKLGKLLQTSMTTIAGGMKKATDGVGNLIGDIGSGVGGAAGELSGAASANPATGEIADYIRQAASARGIDPEVAIRVAQGEGGVTEAARRGTFKTGSSWWPFQLHYGGAGYESLGDTAGMGNSFTATTGFQPGDPEAWKASTDYALDAAAKNGWGAWYGARAAGIGNQQGIPSRDNGGWLMPGVSTLANNTGQPERILAPGQSGGTHIDMSGLTIHTSPGTTAEQAEEIASYLAARLATSLANQRAVV